MNNTNNRNALNELKQLIADFAQENKTTNFLPAFGEHLNIIKKYSAKHRDGVKGDQAFRDRKAYQKFCASSFFYINFGKLVFQEENAFTKENGYEGYYVPPLEAFYYSDEEKEIFKNLAMNSIKQYDVLHLRIVDDQNDEFKLEIINKYGEERRLVDFQVFAKLLKNNSLVNEIFPPLKISDYIRAACFGNFKPENALARNVIMTFNPNYVKDEKLKGLKLGRVYKEDIPFFPEDISEYSCLGEYLEDQSKFETAKQADEHISALQCDPEKTGPFFDCIYKKKSAKPVECTLSEEVQKLSIFGDKPKKAKDLLDKGELENALLEIEEALQVYPKDDMALTLRGKIYLAMAGGKPSRKVRKAIEDLKAALVINPSNKEAAVFHDLIVMESINRFTQNNMVKKAEELRGHLKYPKQVNESAAAFLKSFQNVKKSMQPASTGALANAGATVEIKNEPMEIV